MTTFDLEWARGVVAACDPVFLEADAGFRPHDGLAEEMPGAVTSLLWEADPRSFAARYPESPIVESYGDQWSGVHCIDYWVYVDAETRSCELSTEGWNLPQIRLGLSGRADVDGMEIAAVFRRILGLPPVA